MSIVSRLKMQARYNILTPVIFLALGAVSPALAVDYTVTSPDTDFVLSAGDSLTNRSTITGVAAPAVSSGAVDVTYIDNQANGRIVGGAFAGVDLGGDVDSFNNAGFISSTGGYGVHVVGDLDEFTNSGTINGESTAVYVEGNVGSFSNSGKIISPGDSGVYIGGTTDTFDNSGTITSYETGVYLSGEVGSFSNSGNISSSDYYGVYFDDNAESFDNSGKISSYYTAAYIAGDIGSFVNSGNIVSSTSGGVYVGGTTDSFENSGSITSDETAVYLIGDVGSFSNSGSIRSLSSYGAYLDANAGSVSNSGSINSVYTALYVGGTVGALDNSGTLVSTDDYGIYVSGTSQSVANSGSITSYDAGIYLDDDAGSVTNSGDILSTDSYGVYVGGDVQSFTNSGSIDASDSAVYVSGDVASFTNSGSMISSSYYGVDISGDVGQFSNSGTIEGGEYGVYISGDVTSFDNSGDIVGNTSTGVYIGGDVGAFTNSGSITSYSSDGVYVSGNVGSFSNSGTVTSLGSTGVDISGDVDSFSNSGTIIGAVSSYGVYVGGQVGELRNTGTIEGETGVYLSTGGASVYNSGTIEGYGGIAVDLNGDDNTLALGTGARFTGSVDFGGGANTYLDVSEYHGSIIITDEGGGSLTSGNYVTGDNFVYQTPDQIYVVSDDIVTEASTPVVGLVGGVSNLLSTQLIGSGAGIVDANDMSSAYMATPYTEAETATMDAMSAPQSSTKIWASALGGFQQSGEESDLSAVYGALVAGAHTQVAPGVNLGIFGGYARTNSDAYEASSVDGDVGLLGAYGNAAAGVVDLEFALIGGVSENNSERTISTMMGDETATASYGGWFIAPELGAYLPVLSADTTKISIGGKVGYIGGGFEGYTESGSSANLTVGDVDFGLLTAKLELRGEVAVSSAVNLRGSVALFSQTNVGGSDTEVSLADLAVPLGSATADAGDGLGVEASLGAEMPVSDMLSVSAGVTGTWRDDSTVGGSANVSVGGKF